MSPPADLPAQGHFTFVVGDGENMLMRCNSSAVRPHVQSDLHADLEIKINL